ncbi:hypothetical protein BH11BAC3_BH11BAC3_19080 [soil metagenome]
MVVPAPTNVVELGVTLLYFYGFVEHANYVSSMFSQNTLTIIKTSCCAPPDTVKIISFSIQAFGPTNNTKQNKKLCIFSPLGPGPFFVFQKSFGSVANLCIFFGGHQTYQLIMSPPRGSTDFLNVLLQ